MGLYLHPGLHIPSELQRQRLKGYSPSPVREDIRNRVYSFDEMDLPNEGPIPTREFLIRRHIEARARALKEGNDTTPHESIS